VPPISLHWGPRDAQISASLAFVNTPGSLAGPHLGAASGRWIVRMLEAFDGRAIDRPPEYGRQAFATAAPATAGISATPLQGAGGDIRPVSRTGPAEARARQQRRQLGLRAPCRRRGIGQSGAALATPRGAGRPAKRG
jgi:hypothetical protein